MLATVAALVACAAALAMDGAGSPQRTAEPLLPLPPAQAATASERIAERRVRANGRTRSATRRARAPRRRVAAHYRRTARKRVPKATPRRFLPLYREAARRYGLNWRLLASIHRQETAFSTASTTYHGLNAFGCCAGPMQFNVTNGPVSTWKLYRQAFRSGRRPRSYPHRTRRHPSVYDDFDAIMAAAWLLSDSGAGRALDGAAWRAAYSYYGHDLFGVTYASQVLARAVTWQRYGFCPNCAPDAGLVESFDDTYGAPVRRQLLADERATKKREQRKKRKLREQRERRRERELRRQQRREQRERRKAERRRRELARKRGERGSRDRAAGRSGARRRPAAPPRRAKDVPSPAAPTSTAPSDAPPETTPAPAPSRCSPVKKLLGCSP
ncbi:MAG TPA: hypothetical protein VM299_06820 [Solirubrobacteraceae bacterium]|nr:hypothetical protein [Solirubrobacteraceae bacterium]